MRLNMMMQVYLQKLVNLNLAKNVPTNLMRNVLGFLKHSKQKYWKAQLTKIMQTLEDIKRGCTLQPKEDLHPKREGKKKIESNQKSAEVSLKRELVKEVFHLLFQAHVHMEIT